MLLNCAYILLMSDKVIITLHICAQFIPTISFMLGQSQAILLKLKIHLF